MEEKIDKKMYDKVVKERDDAWVKISALKKALSDERSKSDALRVELEHFEQKERADMVHKGFQQLIDAVEASQQMHSTANKTYRS